MIRKIPTSRPVVCLTYDDGPCPPYTNELLEVCKRFDARATFFATGQNLARHPELGKAIVDEGHELGNHSFSHTRLAWRRPSFLWQELTTTDSWIARCGGSPTPLFRPPYGSRSLWLAAWLWRHGRRAVLWDVAPQPGDFRLPPASQIAETILAAVCPGSIVLLHDGGGDRSRTVAASVTILETLSARGYQFATVSAALALADSEVAHETAAPS